MNTNDHRLDDGTITMRLTPFQAAEVDHGLDIDAAGGNPDWGELAWTGRTSRGPAVLTIRAGQQNLDAALYRVTSSRDIPADNAGDSMNSPGERLGYLSAARSLDSLVQRLIAVAGGPEAFSKSVRRWI
jgi:hypothetical protein